MCKQYIWPGETCPLDIYTLYKCHLQHAPFYIVCYSNQYLGGKAYSVCVCGNSHTVYVCVVCDSRNCLLLLME